jgi:hypothetical protein
MSTIVDSKPVRPRQPARRDGGRKRMKTHTKILAASGAIACAAITVGSMAQSRAKGTGDQSVSGGAQIASKVTEAEPLRVMQGVVSRHMANVQNYLIEKYSSDKVTSEVILAHCEAQLTLRTPGQQKHEINEVWQVDKWRPNTEWQEMRDVPSLVNELLRVDPKVEKEIQAFEDKVSDEFMKPLRDFIARENLASLPKHEANQRIHDWSQKQYQGVTMVERSRRAVERSQRVVDFARSRLTKPQVQEMDRLLGAFTEMMNAIEASARKNGN